MDKGLHVSMSLGSPLVNKLLINIGTRNPFGLHIHCYFLKKKCNLLFTLIDVSFNSLRVCSANLSLCKRLLILKGCIKRIGKNILIQEN
jgi:hypothetical protein